jgi:hypothetical protein
VLNKSGATPLVWIHSAHHSLPYLLVSNCLKVLLFSSNWKIAIAFSSAGVESGPLPFNCPTDSNHFFHWLVEMNPLVLIQNSQTSSKNSGEIENMLKKFRKGLTSKNIIQQLNHLPAPTKLFANIKIILQQLNHVPTPHNYFYSAMPL